jgi:hypothetical protein
MGKRLETDTCASLTLLLPDRGLQTEREQDKPPDGSAHPQPTPRPCLAQGGHGKQVQEPQCGGQLRAVRSVAVLLHSSSLGPEPGLSFLLALLMSLLPGGGKGTVLLSLHPFSPPAP